MSTNNKELKEIVRLEAGSPLQKALVDNFEAQKELTEVIDKFIASEKERLVEEIERLDYYWQREHQDRTLVSLKSVIKIIDSHE